jgi:hypothetical protein
LILLLADITPLLDISAAIDISLPHCHYATFHFAFDAASPFSPLRHYACHLAAMPAAAPPCHDFHFRCAIISTLFIFHIVIAHFHDMLYFH